MSLNQRQKKFCELYISCGNATEAAKAAGYSEKTAYSIGAENLKKPEIQKYIKEWSNPEKNTRIATASEVLEFFTLVMRGRDYDPKNRLRAAENLAKRFGLDKENKEQTDEGQEEALYRGKELREALRNRKIEGLDDNEDGEEG